MITERTAALVQSKLKLAEKYARLARVANSQPKRAKFRHRAERYRRQVEELSRR